QRVLGVGGRVGLGRSGIAGDVVGVDGESVERSRLRILPIGWQRVAAIELLGSCIVGADGSSRRVVVIRGERLGVGRDVEGVERSRE
ncbi:hypothetical protein, partial [Nannocystis exedens]|uniref:hypothetical protein n=1 Tax=Nannocystis exedens TaxID=54 RepID=UPI0015A66E48